MKVVHKISLPLEDLANYYENKEQEVSQRTSKQSFISSNKIKEKLLKPFSSYPTNVKSPNTNK